MRKYPFFCLYLSVNFIFTDEHIIRFEITLLRQIAGNDKMIQYLENILE